MNYMEQVAKMLGVEFGEEFHIKGNDSKFKITKYGMCVFTEFSAVWNFANNILVSILTDQYEIKKPILDDVEKEYLSNVIKPFRDKVTGVIKWGKEIGKGLEYIVVIYTDDCKERGMGFPCFKEGTMYKGMEANKQYSLEDLGL